MLFACIYCHTDRIPFSESMISLKIFGNPKFNMMKRCESQ